MFDGNLLAENFVALLVPLVEVFLVLQQVLLIFDILEVHALLDDLGVLLFADAVSEGLQIFVVRPSFIVEMLVVFRILVAILIIIETLVVVVLVIIGRWLVIILVHLLLMLLLLLLLLLLSVYSVHLVKRRHALGVALAVPQTLVALVAAVQVLRVDGLLLLKENAALLVIILLLVVPRVFGGRALQRLVLLLLQVQQLIGARIVVVMVGVGAVTDIVIIGIIIVYGVGVGIVELLLLHDLVLLNLLQQVAEVDEALGLVVNLQGEFAPRDPGGHGDLDGDGELLHGVQGDVVPAVDYGQQQRGFLSIEKLLRAERHYREQRLLDFQLHRHVFARRVAVQVLHKQPDVLIRVHIIIVAVAFVLRIALMLLLLLLLLLVQQLLLLLLLVVVVVRLLRDVVAAAHRLAVAAHCIIIVTRAACLADVADHSVFLLQFNELRVAPDVQLLVVDVHEVARLQVVDVQGLDTAVVWAGLLELLLLLLLVVSYVELALVLQLFLGAQDFVAKDVVVVRYSQTLHGMMDV